MVNKCIKEITPIESSIKIIHLSDKSVSWISRVGDISSFQSVKNKLSRNITRENRMNSENEKHSHKSTLIPSINSSISASMLNIMDAAPLPTMILVDNDTSLTTQTYSILKLNAIAELDEVLLKTNKS